MQLKLLMSKNKSSGHRLYMSTAKGHLSANKPCNKNMHIFQNSSLLVCETAFLHSLAIGWMCGCRGGGVNMITDVLYSVNMYIHFYV